MSQLKLTSFFRCLSKVQVKDTSYYEKLANNTFLNDTPPALHLQSDDNNQPLTLNANPGVHVNYCMMFDGCSKGNPGPAGAGAVLYANNTEIWAKSIYVGERETNNTAEYTGLILGLNEAVRQNIRILTVKGDSELIIKQMTGRYKVKSENMLEMYERAKELEKQFDKIDYFHVYRHLNSRADALSNEGLAKRRN